MHTVESTRRLAQINPIVGDKIELTNDLGRFSLKRL